MQRETLQHDTVLCCKEYHNTIKTMTTRVEIRNELDLRPTYITIKRLLGVYIIYIRPWHTKPKLKVWSRATFKGSIQGLVTSLFPLHGNMILYCNAYKFVTGKRTFAAKLVKMLAAVL